MPIYYYGFDGIAGGGGGAVSPLAAADWAHLEPGAELLAPIVGDDIPFTSVKAGNGGIVVNASGEVTLKAGKTYEVHVGLGISFVGSGGLLGVHLYDLTNSAELVSRLYGLPTTSASNAIRGDANSLFGIFTVGASDIQAVARVTSSTSATKVYFAINGTRAVFKEIPTYAGAAAALLHPFEEMTTVERVALTVTAGAHVFDTDIGGVFFYNGSAWIQAY